MSKISFQFGELIEKLNFKFNGPKISDNIIFKEENTSSYTNDSKISIQEDTRLPQANEEIISENMTLTPNSQMININNINSMNNMSLQNLKPKQKRKPGAGRKIRNPLQEEYVQNYIWEEFYQNKQLPSRKFMNIAGDIWNLNNPTDKFRKSKGWGDKFWKRNIRLLQSLQSQGRDGEFNIIKNDTLINPRNIDWKYYLKHKDNSVDHWKLFLASFP